MDQKRFKMNYIFTKLTSENQQDLIPIYSDAFGIVLKIDALKNT